MTRQELIKQCRYYKGENTSPRFDDQNKEMLWFYEKTWVEQITEGAKLRPLYEEYETYPTDLIDKEDKIPYSLKALLLNRYCKDSMGTREDDAKNFNSFLIKYYY